MHILNEITATPDVFILQKLGNGETTDQHSRIFCDGHFFPVALHGVPAGDYAQPIYRLTEHTTASHKTELQNAQQEHTA